MSASAAGPSAHAPEPEAGLGDVVGRRAISHGVLALAALLWVGGLPLWGLVALLGDLARAPLGDRRFGLLRFVALLGLAIAAECWGVTLSYGARLWRALARTPEDRWVEWHYRLQRRWGSALVRGTIWIYGLRVRIEGAELLDGRPVLLFMRHTSVADGVLLLQFVNTERGYRLRYVVKRELLYDPCLDVVGHRIPNVFVRRDGGDSGREVARVEALARGLGAHEGLMLFPEGTRFTPARQARAMERLAGAEPALAALAGSLTRSLPPRPGGPLGALRGAPEADVIVVAHVGLEGLTRIWNFVGGDLVGRTLHVRFWRHARGTLPTDDSGRYRWLLERWVEVDRWVGERLN